MEVPEGRDSALFTIYLISTEKSALKIVGIPLIFIEWTDEWMSELKVAAN